MESTIAAKPVQVATRAGKAAVTKAATADKETESSIKAGRPLVT
jgi:hypothetical protein